MVKTTIKLNIGGRGTRIPGFKNLDINPDFTPDILGDASEIPVDSGSVEEIYASHVLEHFPRPEVAKVLTEWHRVLAPGGKLFVAVPDFDAVIRTTKKEGALSDWAVNFLCGDQLYPEAFHYQIYDENRLTVFLKHFGFTVKRIKDMPYNLGDCSSLCDTFDGLPVSLNMEATK